VLLPIVKRATGVQLLGVAAATGLSAKNAAGQFGFSYSTTDSQEVLSDDASRVVFIVTRHDSHAALAAEALGRGKHVFVEKPLATTEDALREVIAAARQSDGLLMVGFNRRFAPAAIKVKEQFRNRAAPMTIVYRVNAGRLAADHWAHDSIEGAGRIVGEVCHFIDFAQYLTDSLPRRVSAEAVGGSGDDSTVISMSMVDGSIASIIYTASGDSALPKEQVEIFCDRAVAQIDDFKSAILIRGEKKKRVARGAQDKGHAAEISAFLEAARGGADAPIELESLAATTLASFAIVEAVLTGTVVEIDLRSVFS
jgi:predicted dehydrogenase